VVENDFPDLYPSLRLEQGGSFDRDQALVLTPTPWPDVPDVALESVAYQQGLSVVLSFRLLFVPRRRKMH
jgi:hypothetical protein